MCKSAWRRVLAAGFLAALLVVFAPPSARAIWVTNYLVLNGCDFVGAGNAMVYNQNGCQVEPLANDSYIYWAAVHLPDGARILPQDLSATICPKTGVGDPAVPMTVELIRHDLGLPLASGVFLRTVQISSPACTLQTDMQNLGELHDVDNQRYSYSIKVNGLKPGYVLYGVRITFQVDDLRPCFVCEQ